jgi:hypothetical protein
MNETRFKSLAELIAGTKDMKRDEVLRLAGVEFDILTAWIEVTPDAHKWQSRSGEVARKVDYFGDLKKLLSYIEDGPFLLQGDKLLPQLQAALKQWDQNAKPDSIKDAGNAGYIFHQTHKNRQVFKLAIAGNTVCHHNRGK